MAFLTLISKWWEILFFTPLNNGAIQNQDGFSSYQEKYQSQKGKFEVKIETIILSDL